MTIWHMDISPTEVGEKIFKKNSILSIKVGEKEVLQRDLEN